MTLLMNILYSFLYSNYIFRNKIIYLIKFLAGNTNSPNFQKDYIFFEVLLNFFVFQECLNTP